jgi:hypothetical protein
MYSVGSFDAEAFSSVRFCMIEMQASDELLL